MVECPPCRVHNSVAIRTHHLTLLTPPPLHWFGICLSKTWLLYRELSGNNVCVDECMSGGVHINGGSLLPSNQMLISKYQASGHCTVFITMTLTQTHPRPECLVSVWNAPGGRGLGYEPWQHTGHKTGSPLSYCRYEEGPWSKWSVMYMVTIN